MIDSKLGSDQKLLFFPLLMDAELCKNFQQYHNVPVEALAHPSVEHVAKPILAYQRGISELQNEEGRTVCQSEIK